MLGGLDRASVNERDGLGCVGLVGRGKGLEMEKRRKVAGVGCKGLEIGTFIVRYLLKNIDDKIEGKIILKSTLSLQNLTCIINRNRVLLCDRHKPSPRSNTVKIPNFTALTSAKHSDRDTEPAYFIRLIKLYIA